MRAQSIQLKLLGAMFVTSLSVLLLTCLALVSYELASYQTIMKRNLGTLAQVISASSTATLVYDDERVAREILSALKIEPDVVAACLFDQRGRLYARYPERIAARLLPRAPGPDGVHLKGNQLSICEPVMLGTARVGTLFVQEDLRGMYSRMRIYGLVVLLVLAGSITVALLLSGFFQKRIAKPILELAGTARLVSERKDYSLRARKTSNDELGVLTDAFNSMLLQIQQRTAALQEAQRKLKQHAQELETRVAERTAKLTETIGDLEAFSYTLTHDLRAPLRWMRGFATVLKEEHQDNLGPQGAEHLERILNAAHRMDMLIQDVLTLSHLSRGEARIEAVDVERLLRGILESYPSFQAPLAHIEIKGPLPWVLGNEAALTQCISNLLGNAVKFVAEGVQPRVQISAVQDTTTVRLLFRDNGIGIPPEGRERLFGMFQRLSSDYEGTGIGLAIVRKAAERMGGRVGFDSESGQGSTFWLQLQLAASVSPLVPAGARRESADNHFVTSQLRVL